MEPLFCVLGGARAEDAAALRRWAADSAPVLNALAAPALADEQPQEDGVHVHAGVTWTVPDVPPGTADQRALLAGFRLVVDRAADFWLQHPVEVAIQYGCCEVGYLDVARWSRGCSASSRTPMPTRCRSTTTSECRFFSRGTVQTVGAVRRPQPGGWLRSPRGEW